MEAYTCRGSVATFPTQQKWGRRGTHRWFLGGQAAQLFDEPDLTPNLIALHPPKLPLADHIHRLISLKRSPGRVKFPEALLGVDPAFDRAMVLFNDVVQVLDGSMATAAAQRSFLLNSRDRRAVDRCQIRIDDARLRMRAIAQSLAKQPFGRIGIAVTPTAGSQLWLPPNRSLDTGSTSGLSP